MNCVKRKMKSTGGASIIIALLFFLICCAVGVSVLASAKANASRLVSQRESEASYLAVRSAAMLMREKLETEQTTPFAECEEYYDGKPTEWKQMETENGESSFWREIESILFQLMQEEGDASKSSKFTFQAKDMPDVSAEVTIAKKGDSFTLEGQFSCDAKYDQRMTLMEAGEVRITENEPIEETEQYEDKTTYTEIIGERREYTAHFSGGKLAVTK